MNPPCSPSSPCFAPNQGHLNEQSSNYRHACVKMSQKYTMSVAKVSLFLLEIDAFIRWKVSCTESKLEYPGADRHAILVNAIGQAINDIPGDGIHSEKRSENNNQSDSRAHLDKPKERIADQ